MSHNSGANNRHTCKRYLHANLIFHSGMPVMLRMNICTSLGLSNRSLGKVVGVIPPNKQPLESGNESISRTSSTSKDSNAIPSLHIRFEELYRRDTSALESTKLNSRCLRWSSRVILIESYSFGCRKGLPSSFQSNVQDSVPHHTFCVIDPRSAFTMGQLDPAFSRAPSLNRMVLLSPTNQAMLNNFESNVKY